MCSPVELSLVVKRRAAAAAAAEVHQRVFSLDQRVFSLDDFEKLVLSSVDGRSMSPSVRFSDTVVVLVDSLRKGDARAVAFRAMCDQYLGEQWNILIEMYDLQEAKELDAAERLVAQMLWVAAQALQWEHCTDAELQQSLQNPTATSVDEWASQDDLLKQLQTSATDSHLAKRPRPNPPEDAPRPRGLMG